MTIRIEPYKLWSGGAKALGNRCGILRATPRQVRKHGRFTYIINWGRSERRFDSEYFNNPEAVDVASDKLRSAQAFRNHEITQPDFTTLRKEAEKWYEADDSVICRTFLRGSGGRGIVLAGKGVDTALVKAPLYTKYAKKSDEYRIHVFKGKVIDIQQKRKRQEVPNEEVNYQIRNASNGWVFCRTDLECPAACLDMSIRAVTSLSLDFGAVDIGYNRKAQTPMVYEVNTAPGLEGSTLDAYYNAFREVLPQIATGAYLRRRKQL